MTVREFRLDDADREKYGGPEWVQFDSDALDDIDYAQHDVWDKAFYPSSVNLVVGSEFARVTALGVVGTIWLARQMAGIPTPDFADFAINHRRARSREVKPEGADVDPPASSPTPSEGEASEKD